MSTSPPPTRALPLALAGVLAAAMALGGCSGGQASPAASPPASSSTASAPPPAPSSPEGSTSPPQGQDPASSSAAAQGPPSPRRLVEAGISVEVPPGWNAASLDASSREAAVAGQDDPQVAAFLRSRLEGMAGAGGVMYLYDLSALDQGVLSAVEVYRYPGTDPQVVADEQVLPVMTEAGLEPVTGTADLPAGPAVTVTGRVDGQGVSLTNEVTLLVLGPSVVSLSATFADPTAEQVRAVLASVRAA